MFCGGCHSARLQAGGEKPQLTVTLVRRLSADDPNAENSELGADNYAMVFLLAALHCAIFLLPVVAILLNEKFRDEIKEQALFA